MSSVVSRYRDVLAAPGAPPLVAAAAVGRLPYGMSGLAVVLLGRAQGIGYGVLGLLVGIGALGSAVALPAMGRAIDVHGERRVLVPVAFGYACCGAGLTAVLAAGAPAGLAVIPALVTGALVPPLGPCMRALWPRLLEGPEALGTAYAFEATIQEFAFIFGPALAAVLAAVVSPASGLIACVAAGAVGALWFAAALPAADVDAPHRRAPARRPALAALAPRGVRTIMGAYLVVGAAFGAVEVAMPAFCEAHGSRPSAGLALAAFSTGSLLGGLWFGASGARTRPLRSYLAALMLLAATLALPLLAWSIPAMVVLIFLAGVPIAPGFAAAYMLLDQLAAQGTATEVYAWVGTFIVVGATVGTAVGGAGVQAIGWTAPVTLAVAAAVLAAALTRARRASLVP